MRIAFLACNRVARRWRENPSYYYRCDNLAEYLGEQGEKVITCHLSQAPDPSKLDVAIFHRPRATWRLRWLLWRYRRAGVVVAADVDDLVFDTGLVRESPAIRNGRVPLPIQWRIFRLQHRALTWFSRITVSTDALAEHARKLFPKAQVSVQFNSVFWTWRSPNGLLPMSPAVPPYVIAYMPGTRSHDQDFALISRQLERFLRDHPDTILRVTGPLNFRMNVPEDQVVRADRVPFERYQALFQGVWVNLAPLEQTPFNECKSALKVIEAGFMGVPTLCSPNPDMARFRESGAVVVEDADWYGALVRLRDPDHYQHIVEGLSARTLSLARVEEQAAGVLRVRPEPGSSDHGQ